MCAVLRLRSSHELQQQVDHLKSSLESAAANRQKLEQLRRGVEDQLETVTAEHHRLETASSELRRQKDLMEDEKSELLKDVERQDRENERWYVMSCQL